MTIRLLTVLLALATATANADWQLDNDRSTLSFVSTKKGDIAEVHHFKALSGRLADDGSVDIAIALTSVDTSIPVRDERMRQFLFETTDFANATVTGKVDPGVLEALEPGAAVATALEAQVSLHGETQSLILEVVAARLDDDTLLVTSRLPVVVQAGDFGLVAGIEKLREIAGLPSISKAVPVSFVITFTQ
jgi:polyisoprenoid-binding protein YceI